MNIICDPNFTTFTGYKIFYHTLLIDYFGHEQHRDIIDEYPLHELDEDFMNCLISAETLVLLHNNKEDSQHSTAMDVLTVNGCHDTWGYDKGTDTFADLFDYIVEYHDGCGSIHNVRIEFGDSEYDEILKDYNYKSKTEITLKQLKKLIEDRKKN